MGYTHYWTLKSENSPTQQEWDKICDEIIRVFVREESEKVIWRESDESNTIPEINSDRIVFNGKEDDGHETFWLAKNDSGFQFCKTARKPYDKFVVIALQTAKDICPDWFEDLSSDGDGENGKNIFK